METKINQHFLTIEQVHKSHLPVVIFGAGLVGEILLSVCRSAGITVECFTDNSTSKTGTAIEGIQVLSPSQFKKRYPDALFLIAVADIRDVVRQLRLMGYEHWTTCSLLENKDILELAPENLSADFVSFAVNTCLFCHRNYLEPEKLFLRSVDLIVTERCSLRCRDCSNLMQYYQKPRDCNTDELLTAIDALCGTIDEINDFRVIGGEPLMNRDVHLIVRRLNAEPKVKRVAIYTNGTLLPRPEQLADFRNEKMLFLITDYGKLSRKLEPLIALLKQEKITYYVHAATGWTACSGIARHCRTAKQQQQIFDNCCAKNLLTLSGNRLYICPFIANAARLKAIPDIQTDYIELSADNPQLRKCLKEFVSRMEFFEGCDYCDGRIWNSKEIPAAIQSKHPLPYHKHETI